MKEVVGPTYAFEPCPEQLRHLLLVKRGTHHAKCVKLPYDPGRLIRWLQDRLVEFRRSRGDIRRSKLHNLRGTAMSKAKGVGVSYGEAAVALVATPVR